MYAATRVLADLEDFVMMFSCVQRAVARASREIAARNVGSSRSMNLNRDLAA